MRGSTDCDGNGSRRVCDGFLTQRLQKPRRRMKEKRRWVVFQGDSESGIFQLKVFKDSDERILKIAHTITKDTFVGIQRGEFEDAKTRNQKSGATVTTYLAVLLVTDTLVFQESTPANLVKWHAAIKRHFDSSSWEVVPVKGVTVPKSPVVLHITQNALSLATADPPQYFRQWHLGRISNYGAWGEMMYFQFGKSDSSEGYFEMRVSSLDHAHRIGGTIARLLPPSQDSEGKNVRRPLPSPIVVAGPDRSPGTPGGAARQMFFGASPNLPRDTTIFFQDVPPHVSPRPSSLG